MTGTAVFSDVPTTEEAGFGYLQSSIWYAVFAPPGTPAAIVDKLATDIRAILRRPDFTERQLSSKGLDTIASTPDELANVVKSEIVAVKDMIDAAKIEPE